jgi:hypothetical protein
MIAGIRRITESALFSLGLYVVINQTRTSDVLGLVRKLRPLDCGIDLIRVGGSGDGGYLIPDDLDGIEYCFSPGVSSISEFENQLANRNIKSFLADFSVDGPAIYRPEFEFDKKFVGPNDSDRFITLASWKDKYLKDYRGDLILQMDIEGFEYAVVLSAPDSLLDQFRIIVIEFHGLEKLFDPFVFEYISSSFDKLLKSFYVAHIHPNNFCGSVERNGIRVPRAMEFTFLNKRRARHTSPQLTFPHRLDEDNIQRASLPLPKCWYSWPYDCPESAGLNL